jgi:hypothetical protein
MFQAKRKTVKKGKPAPTNVTGVAGFDATANPAARPAQNKAARRLT